jgi:hypothetical protein
MNSEIAIWSFLIDIIFLEFRKNINNAKKIPIKVIGMITVHNASVRGVLNTPIRKNPPVVTREIIYLAAAFCSHSELIITNRRGIRKTEKI